MKRIINLGCVLAILLLLLIMELVTDVPGNCPADIKESAFEQKQVDSNGVTIVKNAIIDGHNYEVICYIKEEQTGKIRLISAKTKERELFIPSEIEGDPIEIIGGELVKWEQQDKTVLLWNISERQKYDRIVIPETVLEIEESGFYNARAKKIELPPNMRQIGGSGVCFWNAQIDTVIIQNKNTDITPYSFAYSKIREVVLPKDYEGKIGEGAFKESAIESFTWPSYKSGASKKIGHGIFKSCKKLRKVVFPKKQAHIYIPNSTFYGCTKLKKLTFPASTKKVTYRWHAYAENYKMGPQTLEFKGKKTKLVGAAFEYTRYKKTLLTVSKVIVPPKSKALAYAKKAKRIKSFSKHTIRARIQDHEGPETNYVDDSTIDGVKLTKIKYVIRK